VQVGNVQKTRITKFPILRKIAYRFGLFLFITTIAYLALYQSCGTPFNYLQSLSAPRNEFVALQQFEASSEGLQQVD
jgi:hypothetical protein